MAKESPLQAVKRLYGSKEKLVDSLVGAAKGAGEDASEVKERLKSASNAKLLRLAEVTKTLKDQYGGRDKLVGSLSAALGKAKDKDYIAKLGSFSSAKLIDMMKVAERRAKRAS